MWLGFDLGTQGVRGVAVSESGAVLARSAQLLTSHRDGIRHEQNPDEWWRSFVLVCREILALAPRERIDGIALDGTSGTILLVDTAGRPLTSALMYDDLRAADEARKFNELGFFATRVSASWALPKLRWLLREHSHLKDGVRVAHQVDFINSHLTGCAIATDSSNALKTGYDLRNEAWPRALERLEISGEVLPDVVRPGTQIGLVSAEAAALTGIGKGTPLIAGMTDSCAAQIASGAIEVGDWNSVLGTTLVLKGVAREPVDDPSGVIYSHRSPDGTWLPGGASNAGAGIIARRFAGCDLNLVSDLARKRGPSKVIAYPLAGRGERFPFEAENAEGFVLGEPVDEVDSFSAVLQGIGFVERLCFDYLHQCGATVGGKLTLTGGAARNRYWSQLRANILGRTVFVPQDAEPAFGMALLSASVGKKLSETVKRFVRVREVIDPEPVEAARFREPYLRLVQELERRGWLPHGLGAQARRRSMLLDAA